MYKFLNGGSYWPSNVGLMHKKADLLEINYVKYRKVCAYKNKEALPPVA